MYMYNVYYTIIHLYIFGISLCAVFKKNVTTIGTLLKINHLRIIYRLPHISCYHTTLVKPMLKTIYHLLYFTEIGGKMFVEVSESEKLWRNLMYFRKVKKRTNRRFKMETFNGKTLIWRIK